MTSLAQPHDRGLSLDPSERSPVAQAEQLVIHGLLEFYLSDDRVHRARRVEAVMAALRAPAPIPVSPPVRAPREASRALRLRLPRWLFAAAALVLFATALTFLGLPGEQSAAAQVRQSIAAMKQAGDRRYEVTLVHARAEDGPPHINAIVDTRPPNLLLIRHKPPWATDFITAGRDAAGAWATTRSGEVTRDEPQRHWPPFITDGGETFILNSMDDLLTALPDLFTMTRAPRQAIDGVDTRLFDRITATRHDRRGPRPHTVELWIDQGTHLVERI